MIYLDYNSKTSLYEQLYLQLREDIIAGRIKKNTSLKSLRILEEELGVSRTTIDRAYQQLVAEGYVRSVHGAGYFVEEVGFVDSHRKEPRKVIANDESEAANEVSVRIKYDFDYNGIDPSLFTWSSWQKAVTEAIDYESINICNSSQSPKGVRRLRECLCHYLYHNRGVDCVPEQVVFCSSMQYALSIVLSLFSPKTHRVGFEDPGWGAIRSCIEERGYSITPIPVFPNGLSIDLLDSTNCNLVYTTPSYQLPTGATMSMRNRNMLLRWATENNAYIIESDHNGQLQSGGMMLPPLQLLDVFENVIHIGSLAMNMPYSIRSAYLILPFELAEQYEKQYASIGTMLPADYELAYIRLFESGTIERHIRRMRTAGDKKLSALQKSVQTYLSDYVELLDMSSASNIVVKIDRCEDQEDLLARLEHAGIRIYGMNDFTYVRTDFSGKMFVMGFTSLNEREMVKACQLMNTVLKDYFH